MKYLVPGTTKLAWNMVKHLRPVSFLRSLDVASECPEGHVEEWLMERILLLAD